MTAVLASPVLASSRCACASEAAWHLDGVLACDRCLPAVLRTAHVDAPFAPPCPELLPVPAPPTFPTEHAVAPPSPAGPCCHCTQPIETVAWFEVPGSGGCSALIYRHVRSGLRTCGQGLVAMPFTYQPEEGNR